MAHTGGCHCGKVRFSVDVDLSQPVIECNCSHCQSKGFLLAFGPRSGLDLQQGEDALVEYRFNTHKIGHQFCSACGVQAFAWGVAYPDFMRGLVPVVSAPKPRSDVDLDALRRRLASDPNWNGGRYYATGGIAGTMAALREETLRRYGIEAELEKRIPDRAARDAEIARVARAWAQEFDAHSLLVLGEAMRGFDATPELARIRARVLYVLSRTDTLFPPSLAPGVMTALKQAGVDARYHELDSPHGHLASGTDALRWAPALRRFMDELAA